jgi:hypothetical protein
MKNLFRLLALVCCLIFVSCGGDIKISIFTRDLSDVISSKENVIYTKVNMIVEGLEDESDINFLRQNLNGFSNDRSVEYNYSTSLSFDIKIPIFIEGTKIDTSNDLLLIIGKKNGNKTDFCLKYNKELYNRINNYIYDKHWQNIELIDFKLKFDMNNDERKNITITSFSSYINGKAYPFEYKVALKERDNIVIEVSEIFSKCISEMDNNMVYPVFSIEL